METVTDFLTPSKRGLTRSVNAFRFTAEVAGTVHMGLRSGKMRRAVYKARFLSVAVFALLAGVSPMAAQASGGGLPAPDLGAAANFAVLAGTALTCTDSNVAGTVGINFTTAFASTRCKMQVQYAPGAYSDFLKAYGIIATHLGCDPANILTGTLAGLTLGPGTYCFTAAATLTGTLILTGGGPWIFEIGTTGGAFTATTFNVVSDNPCNAYWWVDKDVTLTGDTFQGTILGGGAITMTGTSLEGRALATGAVTMTGSNIFGCNAAGTVASHHCNQGVGNGPEGCDPGNSNQGDPSRFNDELGGTPGKPGRQGGNGK
jgi:hypothetical protein